MVFCQSGENCLELVIMNRMGQIIGLVLVCRVEMGLNHQHLKVVSQHSALVCSNAKLLRKEDEKRKSQFKWR